VLRLISLAHAELIKNQNANSAIRNTSANVVMKYRLFFVSENNEKDADTSREEEGAN
jgi:hypothetical protein